MIITKISSTIARARAGIAGAALSLATGAVMAQAEFMDRVKSAKAVDSTTLRANVTTGGNNLAAIGSVVFAVVGFAFMIWGIIWVMSAHRSEGRKEAVPGYVMAIGGGALGAASFVYMFFVGMFSSM